MRKSGFLVLILSAKLFAQVNAYPPTASAVPSGAAGGDLAGTYPNPTIDLTLAKAWTAIHTFRANAIAATPTERIRLQNQTAATAGVPSQWSPCIYWEGQGWKTDATAASQKVEFRQCLVPVEGAAAPQARLDFGYAINGGAFVTGISLLNSNVLVTSPGTVTAYGFQSTNNAIAFTPDWLGFALGNAYGIVWSNNAAYTGPKDLGLFRTSAGRMQVNNGTSGKWAALDVGAISMQSLAVPGAPTVTPTCVAGCTNGWSYGIVAILADGTTTEIGATGSTAVGAATLDASNYNTNTWAAVTGATFYGVRRLSSGGTPATLGLIATVTATTFTDDGDVGDGTASPTVNATGSLRFTNSRGDVGSDGGSDRPRHGYFFGRLRAEENLEAGSGFYILWNGRTQMSSPVDGQLLLSDAVASSFSRLQFGGTTASFPAIKRFGNAIGVRAADDTVPAFAALTACSAAGEGAVSPVSDSTTATWGATVTGGGANRVLVYCNGTNWTVAAK